MQLLIPALIPRSYEDQCNERLVYAECSWPIILLKRAKSQRHCQTV